MRRISDHPCFLGCGQDGGWFTFWIFPCSPQGCSWAPHWQPLGQRLGRVNPPAPPPLCGYLRAGTGQTRTSHTTVLIPSSETQSSHHRSIRDSPEYYSGPDCCDGAAQACAAAGLGDRRTRPVRRPPTSRYVRRCSSRCLVCLMYLTACVCDPDDDVPR